MSDEAGFEPGLDVRSVTPGFQAILRHGDGTATAFWGRTPEEAERKAVEAGDE